MLVLKNTISTVEPEKRKSPVEIEEAIRRRAYEFYEQRGYVDGDDVEDWLLAEQEVSGNVRQDKRAVKPG
jgi:hypothetical protein